MEDEKNSKGKKNKVIRKVINYVILTAVSAALVYYLLDNINIGDIWSSIRNINIPLFIVALSLSVAGFYLRAFRYKILLGRYTVGVNDLTLVTVARDLFTDVLPARLGSLSYIYILVRKYSVPLEACMSTFVVSAVLDSIAIMPILFLAIAIVGSQSFNIFPSFYLIVSASAFVVFSLILVFLDRLVWLGIKILDRFFIRIKLRKARFVDYAMNKLVFMNENIVEIKCRRIYPQVFGLTIVIRILKFVVYYILLLSIVASMGYGTAEISFWKSFLGTASAELSATLPTHSFAGIGTYETSWTIAFILLGYPKEFAIVSGFSFHVIKLAYNIVFGLIAVLIILFIQRRYRTKSIEETA
ncbi:MAG: flippase-like domain-containing protein [Actinobacteria bacterium]|nr:flippase-like domain-containing protein [Actinomycetota bacterium]